MDLNENSRLYHRFIINHPRLCYVSRNGTKIGVVTEISYGGLSLTPFIKPTTNTKKTISASNSSALQTIELHFLDRFITCQIEERYSTLDKVGYQLTHEQTQVLSFLKEIIPWIRAGAALSHLQKMEREGFEDELPDYLSFEGPIPIDIEWLGLDSQKLPNFSLNFSQDKVLYQLTKKNEQLETLHNVWPGAESGNLRPTQALDSTILRNGLAVLVGLSADVEMITYPQLINSILELYEKYQQASGKELQKRTG